MYIISCHNECLRISRRKSMIKINSLQYICAFCGNDIKRCMHKRIIRRILRKRGKFKITKTRIKSAVLPSRAGFNDDFHMFDPASRVWTELTSDVSGSLPSPRGSHGFTAAGARLYVHGGWGEIGDVCRGGGGWSRWGISNQKIRLYCVGDSSYETVACKAKILAPCVGDISRETVRCKV